MSDDTGRPKLAPQTLLRVNEVYEMLLAGLRRAAILRYMREKHGTQERTCDKYITLARDLLEEDAKPRRKAELGKTINRLETLFAKHMADRDYRGARQVEEVRIQLFKLGVDAGGDLSDFDRWLSEHAPGVEP